MATSKLRRREIYRARINYNSAAGIVDVCEVPAGAIVMRAWADVKTVFNAGTTNVVLLGYSGTDNAYLATADVVEGTLGVSPAGGKGPFPPETAKRVVQAKYTQSGTAASAGAADVYVEVLS